MTIAISGHQAIDSEAGTGAQGCFVLDLDALMMTIGEPFASMGAPTDALHRRLLLGVRSM